MHSSSDANYGQDIRDRSFRFACRIVEFCRALAHDEAVARILVPQLLRCGTSVGANLEEARGGERAEALAAEAGEIAAILGAITRNARRNASP
jgi:hypothetical protein